MTFLLVRTTHDLRNLAHRVLSCVFVSVAAGISTKTMEAVGASYGVPLKIARAMPNTPCMIGQGAGGLCFGRYLLGPAGSPEAELREKITRLLSAVGCFVQVKESQMDAVTGLSGSGPAFVYLFIEALMDGGVRAGLTRGQATTLATQLVKGAAQMVQEREEHVAALKDAVCSAGGTSAFVLVSALSTVSLLRTQPCNTAVIISSKQNSSSIQP